MFLSSQGLTIPTLAHDYPEWHHGREDYALWYVEIHHPELVNYLNQLRYFFSKELFQPNIRQFHITLFVCGFLTQHHKRWNDDFQQEQFNQQTLLLEQLKIQSFRIKTGKINSFDSALFVEIDDIENSLSKIRTHFYENSQEPAALQYHPHITLGLYQAEIQAQKIFSKIEQIEQLEFEISIEHLTFGFYKAKILQGELYAQQRIVLDSNKGMRTARL